MLELKHITKDYPAGDGMVHALKGIDLCFRDSEFVSILGPSGCGKTTTLNIIGGLDQYSSGDLVINGVSTKHYKDRDWDAYRNYSVGFVFQSYNLIPHQSVLQNVELALSLSGVSKKERKHRAVEALKQVGLGDQLYKKPTEMSGGQMQRVAIARAIINDPDIILADEPTGALDSETGIQVLEILKELSRDRLVVMVTHNPELAEHYSTRIVRMLDGVITDDSAPLSREEFAEVAQKQQSNQNAPKKKRPKMSFATSFGLSLKNLFTKKGRTTLTAFAGSIGIIGIALIYAVSQGTTTYINAVQEETLSSYPLTLEATHTDLGSLMQAFMGQAESVEEHELDAVYPKAMLYNMLNALNSAEETENDLGAFKRYLETQLEEPDSLLSSSVSGVQYTYSLEPLIYTKSPDGRIIRSDTRTLMQEIMKKSMGVDMSAMSTFSGSTGFSGFGSMGSGATLWQEMLPGEKGKLISPVLENQYELIYGSWPTAYNEIVLVVDENNELDDMTLYALGLTPEEDMDKIVDAAINKTTLEASGKSWSFEEICDMEFRTVLAADCYVLDAGSGLYRDLRSSDAGLSYLYDNGTALKVSGIIRPGADTRFPMLRGSIAYTGKLTEYVITQSAQSAAIKAQLDDPSIDIFTGLPFRSSTGNLSLSQKEADFKAFIRQLEDSEKAAAYVQIMSIPSEEQISAAVEQGMSQTNREDMVDQMSASYAAQMGMSADTVQEYLESMSDEEMDTLIEAAITEQFKAQYAAGVVQQMEQIPTEQLAASLDTAMQSYTPEQCADYYDVVLEFSDSDYDTNLAELGSVDLESPSGISLFAAAFADKDLIEDAISAYNSTVDEMHKIVYTDYVGIMMSSVTTILNAITYVLIAFVAVSLIVSSIMIGVITLISVQERTKEIGILRALGASKRNVASMFNAETVIIGFTSGLLGVLITYLLCIPINSILHSLTGIGNLRAFLPLPAALALVCISVILTLIAGIIPSRSAAKKDPIVALRTE